MQAGSERRNVAATSVCHFECDHPATKIEASATKEEVCRVRCERSLSHVSSGWQQLSVTLQAAVEAHHVARFELVMLLQFERVYSSRTHFLQLT